MPCNYLQRDMTERSEGHGVRLGEGHEVGSGSVRAAAGS